MDRKRQQVTAEGADVLVAVYHDDMTHVTLHKNSDFSD